MIYVALESDAIGDYSTYLVRLTKENYEFPEGGATVCCTFIDKDEDALAYKLTMDTKKTIILVDTDDPHEAIGRWLDRLQQQMFDQFGRVKEDFSDFTVKKIS